MLIKASVGRGSTPDTIEAMAHDAVGFVRALGLDQVKVTALIFQDIAKGVVTFQDAKQFLFFTRTTSGRQAGRKFLQRLKERTEGRDKAITPRAFRAHLKAIHRWGLQQPSDLSGIRHPVLVANGESDRMVPSDNTVALAERLPNSELVPLYSDAGHGGIFQYHNEFVAKALDFLEP